MKHRSTSLGPALVLAALLATRLAGAQAPAIAPQTAAQVEALYNKGTAAMTAGNYEEACPSLAKAVKLAPDTAVGARLKLAECYEKWGKLASALGEYNEAARAAQKAGQEDRRQRAEAKAAELRSRVSVLKIEIPAAQRNLAGLVVSLDGRGHLSPGSDPIPVDRGAHAIMVSATGHESRTAQVQVEKDGGELTVVLPALDPIKTASSAAPAPRSPVAGFVLGGVGVAAAVVGVALVGVAEGISSDIDIHVPRLPNGDSACALDALPGENAECADFRSKADSGSVMGNAGIGLLIGGGVLVAGAAIYLWIPPNKTNASNSRVIPVVSRNGGGFVLAGSF